MSVIFLAKKMIFQKVWRFHHQNWFGWGNHGNLKGLHCTLHHSQHSDGMIFQNIPAIDKLPRLHVSFSAASLFFFSESTLGVKEMGSSWNFASQLCLCESRLNSSSSIWQQNRRHTAGWNRFNWSQLSFYSFFCPSMLFSRQTGWDARWSQRSQFSDLVKRNFKKQLFSRP